MKKLLTMTAAAALLAGSAFAQDTVRIGSEGAYPPYNFINDAGELAGFERELGDEICRRAELTCTWVLNDWDSIIPNLTGGNYDVIMAGMNINEERKQVISFTQAYTPALPSAYAALSADANVGDGAVVSAQTNTIQAAYVADSEATLLEYALPDETVAAVRNGEADAVFADKDFLVGAVEESGGQLVWVDGFDTVALGEGIGAGIRQSDTELLAKFDDALSAMKEDGSLNELLVKWFGDEVEQFQN
ncbi:MAG: transporter substrate-binding domain-containing protein [Paracoccus sp. (in: a-proteobacteria)]|nr:transporter substrate-binding domain-containing protein [Paracoccus sp. (in: a-proteobacteria)]